MPHRIRMVIVAAVISVVAGLLAPILPPMQAVSAQPAATTTDLTSSLNPTVPGQSVTFIATVECPVAPTGTVTFFDGTTTLGTETVSNYGATFTTSFPDISTHSITASYGGDANCDASTSDARSQTVIANKTAPSVQNVTITKTASVPSFSGPNLVISYLVTITNAGTTNMTSLYAFDHRPIGADGVRLTACEGGNSSLAGNVTRHCTFTYTTTEADVASGRISDEVDIQFQRSGGFGNVEFVASAVLTIPFRTGGAVGILKTANTDTFTGAGQTITYTYTVTNSGTVPLVDVRVADPHAGSAITCTPAMGTTLAPGAMMTCTATYVTTPMDVSAGVITDSATVTATADGMGITQPSNSLGVGFNVVGIFISKVPDPTQYGAAGQQITYTYAVSSTGGVPLTDLKVTDDKFNDPITCASTDIPANGVVECTAEYTTTPADVAGGNIVNTATATAMAPGGQPVSDTTTATVNFVPQANISITKSADPDIYALAGTPITYTYVVTNTGNVPLTGVAVVDGDLDTSGCAAQTLAPGAKTTCTAVHTTTPADVTAGSVENTATASGTAPTGARVSDSAEQVVQQEGAPDIAIEKTANPESFNAANQTITYTYTVTNNGDVPLTDVSVTDSALGQISGCNHPAELTEDSTVTCQDTTTTSAADLLGDGIENTATAEGIPPPASESPPATATTEPPVIVFPVWQASLRLVKTANTPSVTAAGDTIGYSYTVTNTGNIPISGITVTDTHQPDPPGPVLTTTCGTAALEPGEHVTCSLATPYTVTAADAADGQVLNTATATGTSEDGAVTSNPFSVSVDVRPTQPGFTSIVVNTANTLTLSP